MSPRSLKTEIYYLRAIENCGAKLQQKTLNKALLDLKQCKNKGRRTLRKGNCMTKEVSSPTVDSQVKLECHQETNIITNLRSAILKQDWPLAVEFLFMICDSGRRYMKALAVRACFLLLLNHRKSDLPLMNEFVRECTDYSAVEDVERFIKILFAVRNEPLHVLKPGKHVRKSWSYQNKKIFEMFLRYDDDDF